MRKIFVPALLSILLLFFLGCIQQQPAEELGTETDTTLEDIEDDLSELEELVESETDLGDAGIDETFFD